MHDVNVIEIARAALRLASAARGSFLEKMCRSGRVRREVDALLAADADAEAEQYLERPMLGVPEVLAPRSKAPTAHRIGPYVVEEVIGRGGMGVVYAARDPRLGRRVALKVLSPHLSAHSEAKARFLQEARAASALDHPHICTIYAAGETESVDGEPGGQLFLVMAYYEGETLKEKVRRGPLPVEDALRHTAAIARGLAKAHAAGILHRDIKPANVLVTTEGVAKLLDFGLAKMADAGLTKTGATMGTAAYMSPEQADGRPVDHRTDLWSLGVVLYEMLTGRRPFRGEGAPATLYAILYTSPDPIREHRPDLPEALADLVDRMLQKDRTARPASATDVLTHLDRLNVQDRMPPTAALPRIRRLAEDSDYDAAYRLARHAAASLKGDSELNRLMPVISDTLTVITQPEGARVRLERFVPGRVEAPSEGVIVGETPIRDLRIARGDYRVVIEKAGYTTAERIASSALNRVERSFGVSPDITLDVRLTKTDEGPDDMVAVPGGPYQLVGAGAPTRAQVTLEDYFIDRYAVSNAQFSAFIRAGGYADRTLWPHPMVVDGRELPWEEAMAQFTDRTRLPGPRNWVNQDVPSGKETHPVTDISWYEAAAYAAFVGKRLPTVFEWEKAARDGAYTHFQGAVMPWGWVSAAATSHDRANFSSRGTEPVDRYPFGISPYGAYNMAGNVKEWCANETKRSADGAPVTSGRAYTGGSWNDPMYLFAQYGSFTGSFTSPALGFRCARSAPGRPGDQGTMCLDLDAQTPAYEPVDETTFQRFLGHYQYDRAPILAEVIERAETPDWTREKVQLDVAGEDPILAYLYLPKRAAPPYQGLTFVPGVNVFFEQSVPEQMEWLLSPHIKAGRAVFSVVMKGMIEREWDPRRVFPRPRSIRFRELMVRHATELRRGLDYLETRKEIDMDRLAYVGFSWGAASRLVFAAIESRFRSVVLIGGGIDNQYQPTRPETDNVNFAPRLARPVLMVTGKYDEECSYYREALPLWNLLREPKKLELVEGGHLPAPEARVPVVNQWLNETLGRVEGATRQSPHSVGAITDSDGFTAPRPTPRRPASQSGGAPQRLGGG
ncbi:MAG: SUMF1/EgtB/PvdO family nonheme iron enzyme [Bacteroidota bacterium]